MKVRVRRLGSSHHHQVRIPRLRRDTHPDGRTIGGGPYYTQGSFSLKKVALFFSVADPDPGSGAFLAPWIWDPGWVKSKYPGSGMNNPDHISYTLETIFWG
jgi:hypothetical protein